MNKPVPARPFTGYHMAAILVSFFGVVIAVNLVMARFAISTFGGTVVDNSYVASQRFNGWLADARVQAKLGWTTRISLDPARHPQLAVSAAGAPLNGIAATGTAQHPLGRAPDIALDFLASGAGELRAKQALPPGRWLLRVTIRRDRDIVRLADSVQ